MHCTYAVVSELLQTVLDPEFDNTLSGVVAQHHTDRRSTERLILDPRGQQAARVVVAGGLDISTIAVLYDRENCVVR